MKSIISIFIVIAGLALVGTHSALANPPKRLPTVKIASTKSDLAVLRQAVENFRLDCNRYPTTSEGLKALMNKPWKVARNAWRGPYLTGMPRDPWHHPYTYMSNGVDFQVISMGGEGSGILRDGSANKQP